MSSVDDAARIGWAGWAERYGLLFMRIYLGGFNLASGLNYFLRIMPQPVPADPDGAAFMSSSLHMGLFQLAKLIETVGGACLLFNLSVPFALVLLFPVTVNVLVMDLIASPLAHVKQSGTRNFLFHALLLAGYGRYWLPSLKLKAPTRPIWRRD
jgi:hypothetical protein